VSDGPRAYPFAIRQRVRFGETDMQGVVYYANYLLYAEVGRVAYMREIGLDYAKMLGTGLDLTIGEATVRYKNALRFDEEFDIRLRLGEVKRVSWTFEYAVDRADGTPCAEMSTVQVMLERGTFKAKRIPDDVRTLLERAL
jgi:acyl-CoA thioester hydrolase